MKRNTSFKKRILRIFNNLKQEKKDLSATPLIPIYDKNKFIAYLRVISVSSLNNSYEVKCLAKWRSKHNWWFPAQFKVTVEGTRKWLDNQVLEKEDRLLFMLETASGIPFGHMGFYRFNFSDCSCEIDNIVRGESDLPGAMTPALKALLHWSFNVLKVETLYLKTYFDNKRAIALYKRCGFKEVKKIPLKEVVENNMKRWEEQLDYKGKAKRYFLQMILRNSNL